MSRFSLALAVVACTAIGSTAVRAQETLDLVCPCRLESSAAEATVTLAVRNFRSHDSGNLQLVIGQGDLWLEQPIAEAVPIGAVSANSEAVARSYSVVFDVPPDLTGEHRLLLVLNEDVDGVWAQRDRVIMANPVDLSTLAFEVGDLDYLADADGDGVGDVNERLAGTDVDDPKSHPGDVEVDVLALHNVGFTELYKHDPYTRIRHVMMVANEVFQGSDTGIRIRLVGFATAEVEDDEDEFSSVDSEVVERLREEYGADLVVMFRPAVGGGGSCGWAGLTGYRARGYISLDHNAATYATVFGECGGATTAHEIGHLLGLGHSSRQNAMGVWRWSRGYYVEGNKGTVMSYGHSFKDRFSNPKRDCGGLPCGREIDEADGAHAVASLNAVRFQIGAFADGKTDADQDGVIDTKDAFPDEPNEWQDTDGDGTGNVADDDDDGDGVKDNIDAFPLDASEVADRDDDGVGDNADAFPDDPEETDDSDGDGVGDNSDMFPNDPSESVDSDGDGVGDNSDVSPNDPSESVDSDGDGIGDNSDLDADNDGVANTEDVFPFDPDKTDLGSYLIRGEQPVDGVGAVLAAAGDMNGDGVADFVIGAPAHQHKQYDALGDPVNVGGGGAVYLISGADLSAADAADGTVDRVVDLHHAQAQPGSWKFVGATRHDRAGSSVAVGDWNADGQPDLAIGAPASYRGPGRVYLVNGTRLGELDAADGQTDGLVSLAHVADGPDSWLLLGERYDEAGASVAIAQAIDDDGQVHIVVGAPGADEGRGAAYAVSMARPVTLDAADDARDGVIELAGIAAERRSWKLVGTADSRAGMGIAAADLDSDGLDEIVVAGPGWGSGMSETYIVSADLLSETDGDADGVVELSTVPDGSQSWALIGEYSWTPWVTAHANEDGSRTIVHSTPYRSHVVSVSDLAMADTSDGEADGVVRLPHLRAEPNSLRIWAPLWSVGDVDGDGASDLVALDPWLNNRRGEHLLTESATLAMAADQDGIVYGHRVRENSLVLVGARAHQFQGFSWPHPYRATAVSDAGDVDGDGLADLLLGAPGREHTTDGVGEVFMLMAADFTALDRVDGVDGQLLLSNLAGDADQDGFANTIDLDDDGDGRNDPIDDFPLDALEWNDADGDGTGDNKDALPDDADEQTDLDGDGIGDNADADDDGDGIPDDEDDHPRDTDNDGSDNAEDADDDNDGVPDANDDLPLDPNETKDADSDGVGDNADDDDDNDGVADADDAFPFDASESADADGDGVGDNADAFPNDRNESADLDADGIGDNADTDDDNDGVADADDAFPFDASESADADGDGVGDNADAFPNDRNESADLDADGIGDNADTDDDNDGVADTEDIFPRLASKSTFTSYELLGAEDRDQAGFAISSLPDQGALVVGAPRHDPRGAVYAIAVNQMAAGDAMDGHPDRQINLGNVHKLRGSWKLLGEEESQAHLGVSAASFDFNADGKTDLMLGAGNALRSAVYATTAGVADTSADSVVMVSAALAEGSAYRITRGGGDSWGAAVAALGDLDSGGRTDFIVGAPGGGTGGGAPGSAEIVLAEKLQGNPTTINIFDSNGSRRFTWQLIGESPADRAGTSVAGGNGVILVGAPAHDAVQLDEGAVYLLPSAAIEAADDADGSRNRSIELVGVSDLPNAYKFVGEGAGDRAGTSVWADDMDGDGIVDVLIGTDQLNQGAAYLVSGAQLMAADEADGSVDGVINLDNVAALPNCWRLLSTDLVARVAPAGDVDGDGTNDFLVSGTTSLYLISSAHLAAADAADGELDGQVELRRAADQPGSWQLRPASGQNLHSAQGVGDLDGDGFTDLAIGTWSTSKSIWWEHGHVYFLSATDLPALDAADEADGVVNLDLIGSIDEDNATR